MTRREVTWRKALLYGLVFGVSGLAYLAYREKVRKDKALRERITYCYDGCGCEDHDSCSQSET